MTLKLSKKKFNILNIFEINYNESFIYTFGICKSNNE